MGGGGGWVGGWLATAKPFIVISTVVHLSPAQKCCMLFTAGRERGGGGSPSTIFSSFYQC